MARLGLVRRGRRGRRGLAGHGKARQGTARQARRGKARCGEAGQGRHGKARQGGAGLGEARQARLGPVGHGKVWSGRHNSGGTMKKFKLRRGTTIKGVSAQEIGEELTTIYTDQGKLTAPIIVDAARPEDAVLHPVFEWDDSVAGERWREHEARNLIKVVEVEETKAETVSISPVFLHVPDQQEYHTTEVVLNEPNKLASAVAQLQRQISGLERTLTTIRDMTGESENSDIAVKIMMASRAFDTIKSVITSLH